MLTAPEQAGDGSLAETLLAKWRKKYASKESEQGRSLWTALHPGCGGHGYVRGLNFNACFSIVCQLA